MENIESVEDGPTPPDASLQRPNSPDNPSWGSAVGLGVWVFSVAMVIFLPSIFLLPYVFTRGPSFSANAELLEFVTKDPTAIIVQMSAIIPAHLLTLLLAWAVVTKMGRQPFFESLGWHGGGVKAWHYVAMLVAFLGLVAAVTSLLPLKEDELERIIRSSRTALYLVAAMAVLTAPLVEEVVYRGVLYSGFRKQLGTLAAVALVTILFTAVHIPQYIENPGKIAVLGSLSLGLTMLRAFSGSLLPCFILHLLVNGLQAIVLIAEPQLQKYGVIEPVVTAVVK